MVEPERLENLTVECSAAIAIVTITRPRILNALNTATLLELIENMACTIRIAAETARLGQPGINLGKGR